MRVHVAQNYDHPSGRPRGPQAPLQKAGREAPRLLEWFLGPPGRPDPKNQRILGPGKIGFHDYIDTKMGLISQWSTNQIAPGPQVRRAAKPRMRV